jgi:hypothetical protein
VPAGWVTADAVYGNSPALRGWLEGRQLPYVLAVKATEPLLSPRGPSTSAARLAEQIPPECWLRITAGHRRCAGGMGALAAGPPQPDHWGAGLLCVRRPGRSAAGRAGAGRGCRWRVEEAFQAGKGLCGLDQHQVRRLGS